MNKYNKYKVGKILLIVLATLGALICLIPIALGIFLYIELVDVSGISFYKDAEIKQIQTEDEMAYFITEDGKGYVTSYNIYSTSRTYRNAEFYSHYALDIPSPVLFWDGEIEVLEPTGDGTYFITSDKTLYRWSSYYFEVEKIAESVIDIDFDFMKTTQKVQKVYFIDVDYNLWMIDHENAPVHILSDVRQVQGYHNRIWVVMNDGVLYEALENEQGYTLSEPIFEDVVTFDVVATAQRSHQGQVFFYDEESLLKPLMNVLTEDGTLYAKGAYNSCHIWNAEYLQVYEIDEWEIIGENVSDYSVARMGTVMAFRDGTCAYYGFNLQAAAFHEMLYQTLPITNVKNVYASKFCVQVEDENKTRYFWGDSNCNVLLYKKEGHDDITSDEPLIIDYPS